MNRYITSNGNKDQKEINGSPIGFCTVILDVKGHLPTKGNLVISKPLITKVNNQNAVFSLEMTRYTLVTLD